MKLSVEFPSVSYREGPEAVRRLARAIEDIGYDHIDIFDHVVMGQPVDGRPAGPYNPGMPILEALITLGFIAAATSRVTLGTEVLVLPQREPTLVAKQVSSLDTLSGGRMRLGVGVGWQESEYEALGEDFRTRGARVDEAIRLLRAYWADASVDFAGQHYRAHAMAMEPKPPQGGRLPIWIGGYSEAAFRRTGQLGDGWVASRVTDAESARAGIAAIRGHAEQAGRDPAAIGLQSMVAPPPRDAAGKQFYAEHDRVVARAADLAAMGFSWVSLNATAIFQAGARSVDAMIDALGRLHARLRAGARGAERACRGLPTIPPRWRLLAYLTAAYAAGAFGVLGVSPLSPVLLDAFALSRFQVGLLLPAVYVGGLVVSVPAGRLADRWGARVCLLGGLALSGALLALGSSVAAFDSLIACLVVAGVGWSIVNPAIGRAIIELFPAHERGLAMGIKQMGLTVGGIASALALPPIAAHHGWRGALALCAVVALVPVAAGWRPMRPLARPVPDPAGSPPARTSSWWWIGRPAIALLFAAGLGLGMIQSAVLGYLPLFGTQGLRLSPVEAGWLLAASQVGATAARLVLGYASDRWLGGERIPWLVGTALVGAGTMLLFAWPRAMSPAIALAAAFWIGVGAFGWVGIYLVLTAEVGGRDQAGFLTGVAMGVIFAGILVGAPLFGALLERADSYAVPWLVFAALSAAVGAALWSSRGAIHRERRS